MWINLQGKYINFDLVKRFYREDSTITYIIDEKVVLFYKNIEKAKQVEEFIVKSLNGELIKLEIDEEVK
jgi:hypothetical protein